MDYKTVKIDRLFHGYASVRDFDVMEAKRQGMGLKIICGHEYILVDYNELDKHYKNKEVFTSIHYKPNHPNYKYTLCDFDWRTFKPKEKPTQFDLFQTLLMNKLK